MLWVMCMTGGLVPPLYLHSSLHTEPRGRLSESGPEVEWEHRMAQASRDQARIVMELCACAVVMGLRKCQGCDGAGFGDM